MLGILLPRAQRGEGPKADKAILSVFYDFEKNRRCVEEMGKEKCGI